MTKINSSLANPISLNFPTLFIGKQTIVLNNNETMNIATNIAIVPRR